MKQIYAVVWLLSMSILTVHAAHHKTIKHTIKRGETLYTIAHANHTTIKEVQKLNGLKKGEILKLGRVLKVPQNTYFPHKKKSKKTMQKFAKHTIKKGESLYVIAHKNHTTVVALREVNGLQKGALLKVGKVLKVPTGTSKVTIAKITHKTIKHRSYRKKHNKKFVASLSKLKIISLQAKGGATKKKKRAFSLRNLFSKRKSHLSISAKITSLAKKKLGRRYVWGATGERNTFDCSGFTKYVYKKNGINLPRRAIAQSKYGKYVPRSKLKKGDLIFFDTSKHHRGYVNHVGIYLGNGKFIHASSAKKKVVITSLHKAFYSQRYKGARRPS